jgi:release factor H-coupled RctB family protein
LASPALGTIGGGNHFVEFQRIEAVADEARFAALGLAQDRVWMMVHSGSRGLGQAVLQAHRQPDAAKASLLACQGQAYLADHDAALGWATLNRQIIACAFATASALAGAACWTSATTA